MGLRRRRVVTVSVIYVTGKDPQAYARGYNPVREGGDLRFCAPVTISPRQSTVRSLLRKRTATCGSGQQKNV